MEILLSAAVFSAGCLTFGLALSGFFLRFSAAKKIFTDSRPLWLGRLCWAYCTLTILAWIGFFQNGNIAAFFAAAIVTLTAFKLGFFFLSYPGYQKFFILLWSHRPALTIVLISSAFVGALMIYTAFFLL